MSKRCCCKWLHTFFGFKKRCCERKNGALKKSEPLSDGIVGEQEIKEVPQSESK